MKSIKLSILGEAMSLEIDGAHVIPSPVSGTLSKTEDDYDEEKGEATFSELNSKIENMDKEFKKVQERLNQYADLCQKVCRQLTQVKQYCEMPDQAAAIRMIRAQCRDTIDLCIGDMATIEAGLK